jgi:hypothetical protein
LTVVHKVVREAVEVNVRTAEVLDSSQEDGVRCIPPGVLRVVLEAPDRAVARVVEVDLVLVVQGLDLAARAQGWVQPVWFRLRPRRLVRNVQRVQKDVDVRYTRRPKKVR